MTGLHLHKGQNASKLVLLKIGTVSRYPEFGGTPICLICSLVKSFNEYYYFKITSIFKNVIPCDSMLMPKDIASVKGHFEVFPKEKRKILHYVFGHTFLIWSCFVTFCHASPDIFCSKDKNFEFYNSFPTFWGQKLKFTIHLSLFTVTIHLSLFTCYCS